MLLTDFELGSSGTKSASGTSTCSLIGEEKGKTTVHSGLEIGVEIWMNGRLNMGDTGSPHITFFLFHLMKRTVSFFFF